MLFARLENGQQVNLVSCSITEAQDSISTFDIKVLRSLLIMEPDDMQLGDVYIYFKGEEIASGVIEDHSLEKDESEQIVISFHCVDMLGKLSYEKPRIGVIYDDQELIFILGDILSKSNEWLLDDATTIGDLFGSTSIDLSFGQDSMWAQIIQAINSFPEMFTRYGGLVNGYHRLEIGAFGDYAVTPFVQGYNTDGLEVISKRQVPIYKIQGYGGKYSDPAIYVTLQDALTGYPNLASHPDYPIVADDDGELVVRNNAISRGRKPVKAYDKYAPADPDSPSAAQIQSAGYALWQGIVREMQESMSARSYSTSVIRVNNDVMPRAGQQVYVRAVATERGLNALTENIENITTLDVQRYLRATSRTITFTQDGYEQYSYELTEGKYDFVTDESAQIYDKIKEGTDKKESPVVITNPAPVLEEYVELPYRDISPDEIDADGRAWKTFYFQRPALPVGATRVAWAVQYRAGSPTDIAYGSIAASTPFTHEGNCRIVYTITTLHSSGTHTFEFRRQDSSNLWRVSILNTGEIDLYEVVGGSPTLRDSSSAGIVISGSVIQIICEDESITVDVDGIQQLEWATALNFRNETDALLSALGTGGVTSDLTIYPYPDRNTKKGYDFEEIDTPTPDLTAMVVLDELKINAAPQDSGNWTGDSAATIAVRWMIF